MSTLVMVSDSLLSLVNAFTNVNKEENHVKLLVRQPLISAELPTPLVLPDCSHSIVHLIVRILGWLTYSGSTPSLGTSLPFVVLFLAKLSLLTSSFMIVICH